ncbi:hypothetical protein ABZP36_003114 [Zizania latifolia]
MESPAAASSPPTHSPQNLMRRPLSPKPNAPVPPLATRSARARWMLAAFRHEYRCRPAPQDPPLSPQAAATAPHPTPPPPPVPNPLGPGHLASPRLADPITKQEGFSRAAMREIAPHGEGHRRGAAATERGRRWWKRRRRRKGS